METINNIELRDESVFPDEKVLRNILGNSFEAYSELLQLYDYNELTPEWRYYHDGKAWLCKVQKKKKTIVWMSAWKAFMQVTIYIPERLIDKVYGLPISKDTVDIIQKTKNVGKSKPCIFEVRTSEILKDFSEVMKFKIDAK